MGKFDPHSPFLRGEKSADWKQERLDPHAMLAIPTQRPEPLSSEEELRQYLKQINRRPGYAHVVSLLHQAQRKR